MRDAVERGNSLYFALRALFREVFQFRFDYPLEIVLGAGPKDSLAYYLYSDALSWDVMRLDSLGIPRAWNRLSGAVYAPGYIAWYGLVNLGHYLRRGNQTYLTIFLNQVDWLEHHAILRNDGAVVWPMDFDYREGATLLRRPWVSANVQGLVISALVRGWRITKRPALLQLLQNAARIYRLDVDHGGIRCASNGHITYTEKPGVPPPVILDGFMTSLLGLYDLFTETHDTTIEKLFTDGIEGLKALLPVWDYRGKWSWYGGFYLSPPSYHCLNRLLLTILTDLSGEWCLREYAERWDHRRLSFAGRTEIYLLFLLTKNVCRLKYQPWTQRRNTNSLNAGLP